MKRRGFAREIDALDEIFRHLEDFVEESAVDDGVAFTIKLVVEELFTNMVRHNSGGGEEIDLGIERADDCIHLELVDTGGMGVEDEDDLTEHIEEQIELAIDSAAVILFICDTRAGITSLDEEVARRLRYAAVPVFCVANKTDTAELTKLLAGVEGIEVRIRKME